MGQVDGFAFGERRPRLRPGLRVTHLGDERLVLDPASGVVHTVRGAAVRVLDAVLAGRHSPESELIAALAGAGIVELNGISRRSVLAMAGSAGVLVSSVALPVATAAASGPAAQVSGSGGIVSQYSVTSGDNTFELYRIAHESLVSSSGDLTRLITLTSAAEVSLLLVGGGGGGGSMTAGGDGATGGGGAGEVHEIDLGSVDGDSVLTVVVGGRATAGNSGNPTRVSIDSVVVGEAKGGGAGADDDDAAASGGSGGGGSSFADKLSGASAGTTGTTGATATSGALSTTGSAGGGGDSGGAGGGGGGAETQGTDGSSETGGAGGSATDINSFFGTYSTDSSPNPGDYRYVAAGGGGGGKSTGGGGGAGADSVTLGGDGSTDSLAGSPNGTFATGSGGGGGSASLNASYAGLGGSGVAWVRIKVQ